MLPGLLCPMLICQHLRPCPATCPCRHGAGSEDTVYEKLPSDIAQRYVLLLDPVLSSGNCAARAIQVGDACWHMPCLLALHLPVCPCGGQQHWLWHRARSLAQLVD